MKLMFGLSIGFQNGMSWSHSIKTHKLVWVLGNGPFPDQGPGGGAHGAGSLTQQYDFIAEQTLSFSIYFMQQIKSYSIFTFRQTYRWTFCIPVCMGEIFSVWKVIPFTTLCSFICFAHSLTLFVKDKIFYYTCKAFIGWFIVDNWSQSEKMRDFDIKTHAIWLCVFK